MSSYDGFDYHRFKELAGNSSISTYEKIRVPDSYLGNTEVLSFKDILSKVPKLAEGKNLKVLDIGSGCSDLQKYISSICEKNGHALFLADCPEMLELIENKLYTRKHPVFSPDIFEKIKTDSLGIDVIICYSVFQCIFAESNMWHFLDCIIDLMNIGGETLIGDIPDISKRKRFFASKTGTLFHQKFMNTKEVPNVVFNCIEPNKIDDSVLLAMASRYQYFGLDAYIYCPTSK